MKRQPYRTLTGAFLVGASDLAQVPKQFDVATVKPYVVYDGNFMIPCQVGRSPRQA